MPSPADTRAHGMRDRLISRLLRAWYSPLPPRGLPQPLAGVLDLCTGLYAAGLRRDQARALTRRRRLPVPVISVGNLTVGGTGKTPLVLWLARTLRHRHPAILSRGYGGTQDRIARVAGDTVHAAQRFGDEPALMARTLESVPVWVGHERFDAGRQAIRSSRTDLILLDDGFQHLALHRDLDIVLLDAVLPFGNGLLLPCGPLREPVDHLARADVILLTRADDERVAAETRAMIQRRFPGKAVFACTHRLTSVRVGGAAGRRLPLSALQGQRVLAFAGVARPGRFFEALEAAGLVLGDTLAFPDHHPYGRRDLAHLLDRARRSGSRTLVTTEKDGVRLPPTFQPLTCTVELELDFGADLDAWYGVVLGQTPPPLSAG